MADYKVTQLSSICFEDLSTKLNNVKGIKDKVVKVYTEDELFDIASQIQPPCVGIVYEGMRSVPDGDKTGKGGSVLLSYSLVLILSGASISNFNDSAAMKSMGAHYMDEFREAIFGTRSPMGTFWKFSVEAAIESKKGAWTYIQRWQVAGMLTSTNN